MESAKNLLSPQGSLAEILKTVREESLLYSPTERSPLGSPQVKWVASSSSSTETSSTPSSPQDGLSSVVLKVGPLFEKKPIFKPIKDSQSIFSQGFLQRLEEKQGRLKLQPLVRSLSAEFLPGDEEDQAGEKEASVSKRSLSPEYRQRSGEGFKPVRKAHLEVDKTTTLDDVVGDVVNHFLFAPGSAKKAEELILGSCRKV